MHAQLALYEHTDCGETQNAITLDIINDRLWFTTQKQFYAGDMPVFSIRLGWKRRITFRSRLVQFAGRLSGENVYVGDFLDIHPDDLTEIRAVILGSDARSAQGSLVGSACAA